MFAPYIPNDGVVCGGLPDQLFPLLNPYSLPWEGEFIVTSTPWLPGSDSSEKLILIPQVRPKKLGALFRRVWQFCRADESVATTKQLAMAEMLLEIVVWLLVPP